MYQKYQAYGENFSRTGLMSCTSIKYLQLPSRFLFLLSSCHVIPHPSCFYTPSSSFCSTLSSTRFFFPFHLLPSSSSFDDDFFPVMVLLPPFLHKPHQSMFSNFWIHFSWTESMRDIPKKRRRKQ